VDLPQPRPDQDDELAVLNIDIDSVDDLGRAEGLFDVGDYNTSHGFRPICVIALLAWSSI
jgi:hypothetical protein